MNINGFKLQLVLKQLNANRDLVVSEFADSLHRFDDEKKNPPESVFAHYQKLEDNIARVQTAQALYNTMVQVDVMGKTLTLTETVKRVGGATRMEKLWRSLLKREETPRWARSSSSTDLERSTDKIYAKATITREEIFAQVRRGTQYTAALREAIQKGNVTEYPLDTLLLTADCLE